MVAAGEGDVSLTIKNGTTTTTSGEGEGLASVAVMLVSIMSIMGLGLVILAASSAQTACAATQQASLVSVAAQAHVLPGCTLRRCIWPPFTPAGLLRLAASLGATPATFKVGICCCGPCSFTSHVKYTAGQCAMYCCCTTNAHCTAAADLAVAARYS